MMARIFAFFLIGLTASVALADDSSLALLSNGQVVRGKILEETDRYVVIKETGSKIVFAKDRVRVVCSDWDHLYWEKCAMLRATDSVGHTKLFHWCIKHTLVDAAQNQIDLLQQMDLSAKHLHQLDQRLQATRTAMAAKLKKRARELVRQAEALAAGRKDYKVMQAGYEEGERPIQNAADAVVRIPVRSRKSSENAEELSAKLSDVDPFDPNVFNRKYVLQDTVAEMEAAEQRRQRSLLVNLTIEIRDQTRRNQSPNLLKRAH